MTKFEILYLITCFVSIFVAIIAIFISISAKKQANDNLKQANDLSQKSLNINDVQSLIALGMIELSMYEKISQTRQKISDITMIMAPLISKSIKSKEEENTLEIYIKILNSEIENNINAYEEACMKYLDNKVDVDRFKKAYFTEIRQLVEHEKYKKYFDAVSSRYKAILKVYNEWFNLEK